MSSYIEEVMPLVRHEVLINSISLQLELASALPRVFGDRVELQQVIINLLVNSIQAMNEVTDRPRELLIRSREHGADQILVEVEDSGTGIERENINRLLSISRSILNRHDGRIWATSKAGTRSAIRFTLPACHEVPS
jgi:signal transduction histidine kinase